MYFQSEKLLRMEFQFDIWPFGLCVRFSDSHKHATNCASNRNSIDRWWYLDNDSNSVKLINSLFQLHVSKSNRSPTIDIKNLLEVFFLFRNYLSIGHGTTVTMIYPFISFIMQTHDTVGWSQIYDFIKLIMSTSLSPVNLWRNDRGTRQM